MVELIRLAGEEGNSQRNNHTAGSLAQSEAGSGIRSRTRTPLNLAPSGNKKKKNTKKKKKK